MTPRTLHLDWRGKPDLFRSAEFYSIYNTAESRPVTGNPKGRVLVSVSATCLCSALYVAETPYNLDLARLATEHGAYTGRTVWQGDGGWHTVLIDMTRRGMIAGWLALIDKHFPWADGIHLDYASAWSWQFPDLAPTDDVWSRVLSGFCAGILERKKLALAQQWHPTEITQAASGAWLEQSPTSFGYTMTRHAQDIIAFRDQVKRVDGRETLFCAELREPAKFPQWYIDEMLAWAIKNDVVVSFGRDAAAGVGLA